jgi:hypothetical protein
MFLKAFACALLALAVGTAATPPPQANRIIVHK